MFDWFSENFLKANADKCHLIKRLRLTSRLYRYIGIYIGNRLNFDYHVSHLVRKPPKTKYLARIFKHVEISKRSVLVNSCNHHNFQFELSLVDESNIG